MEHVYFDHNATTPLDERVLEAMLPFLRGQYGNASSRHELGTQARKAVNAAREQVAALVNVQPSQVIFVSGGTEANNLFIKGAAGYLKPTQIAVSAIEHPVRREAGAGARARGLESAQARRRRATGEIDLADVDGGAQGADRHRVGHARQQRDRRHPGRGGGRRAGARGARRGCTPTRCRRWARSRSISRALNVHAMTLSAHKIYGPKGVGRAGRRQAHRVEAAHRAAAATSRACARAPRTCRRSSASARPCELAAARAWTSWRRGSRRCARALGARAARAGRGDLRRAARRASRTRRTSRSTRIDGETLVIELDKLGYAVAPGAACSSANPEPSATLLAMGVEPELARGAVRFSLGAGNTAAADRSNSWRRSRRWWRG